MKTKKFYWLYILHSNTKEKLLENNFKRTLFYPSIIKKKTNFVQIKGFLYSITIKILTMLMIKEIK